MQGLLGIEEWRRPPQGPGRASRKQWHTGVSGDLPDRPGRPSVSQAEGRLCGRELKLRGRMGICSGLLGVSEQGQADEDGEEAQDCGWSPVDPAHRRPSRWCKGGGRGRAAPPSVAARASSPGHGGQPPERGRDRSKSQHPPSDSLLALGALACAEQPELPGRLLGSEAWAGRAHCTLCSLHRGGGRGAARWPRE